MSTKSGTTRVKPFRPATALGSDAPCIEVLTGSSAGTVIALEAGVTFVGRAKSNGLSLDDDGISRVHAKVSVSADATATWFDLDSTNGSFVNGARVTRMALREGDRIQLGPAVALRFGHRSQAELDRGREERPSLPPPPSAETPLSARELEIAQLVAEGCTNAEIGKRLHISARTVGTHLANVYQRLELHSRAALTRYLHEQALLPPRR